MTLTDEELERDWKPSGRRPVSTIARSFSAELMDIFKIDGSVADLDASVNKRKHHVNSQHNELESLEARIREMEERLRRSQVASHTRRPIPPELQQHEEQQSQSPPAPPQDAETEDEHRPPMVPNKDIHMEKSRSRPGSSMTARAAPSSGAMPPTPVASEGEYDIVERTDLEDDEVEPPRRS